MTKQNPTIEESEEYKKLLRLKDLILDKYIITNNKCAALKRENENLKLWIKKLESTSEHSKTTQ